MKAIIISLASALISSSAIAGDHSLKVGAVAIGSGGTNPMMIFNPSEWEYTYVSQANIETNIAFFPGILCGLRFSKKGLYFSGGGGYLSSANGFGPGVYNSFGYITSDAAPGFHFNVEYKQSLGYSGYNKQVISPSALRIGIIWN